MCEGIKEPPRRTAIRKEGLDWINRTIHHIFIKTDGSDLRAHQDLVNLNRRIHHLHPMRRVLSLANDKTCFCIYVGGYHVG